MGIVDGSPYTAQVDENRSCSPLRRDSIQEREPAFNVVSEIFAWILNRFPHIRVRSKVHNFRRPFEVQM